MKKQTAPRIFVISIFVLAAIFPAWLSGNQIEIIRDYWGIAHIYADNDLELFFGSGYATAEDRMFQMKLSRRKVAGTLSEIYGKDLLESDKLMRTLGLYKLAQEIPHVLNPSSGFVASANHLPVGDWYPHSLTIGTGGTGHNPRSIRLYELQDDQNDFTFESFSEIHRDDVSAIARDFLSLARTLSERNLLLQISARTLKALSDWDYRLLENSRAADVAETIVQVMHRSLRPSTVTALLASKYGGGHAGNIFLLRSAMEELERTQKLPDEEELAVWVNQVLEASAGSLREPVSQVRKAVMVYQTNLEGLPSIYPDANRIMPDLVTTSGNTIWSQLGNSYTQVVDLSNIDNSRAFLPPGISEDPRSPHFFDQIELWVAGETRPAPLSREEVMKYAESIETLSSALNETMRQSGSE
jgi:penicillin amidase